MLRLVENEEVFRREARHTPHAATGNTPEPAHPDARALAADRAWLASRTGSATPGTGIGTAADENGNAR